MTMLNAQSSWNVGHVGGTCAACGASLPANSSCWAALCDHPMSSKSETTTKPGGVQAGPSLFARVDFCESCWGKGARPVMPLEMFSFWKTTVPMPQQKKKLLVDDAVLVDVFGRMEGRTEPQEVRFRFVLALILMRKRLLKYEGSEPVAIASPKVEHASEVTPAPIPEMWRMIPRGSEKAVHVINPHLTAEQITEVSQQLSAILAEEV